MLLPSLVIALDQQKLYHREGEAWRALPVSTAKKGAGERINSYCTPRGLMSIRAKVGAGADPLMVFRRRRATGELCTPEVYAASMNHAEGKTRDWILGRIMWLSGLEPHINRFGRVDTLRRFIYIHGTPLATDMQTPGSIGCVRMQPDDLLPFFAQVAVGSRLLIVEHLTTPWLLMQPDTSPILPPNVPPNVPSNATERLTLCAYPPPATLMQLPTHTPFTPWAALPLWREAKGSWQLGVAQKFAKEADETVMAMMQARGQLALENAGFSMQC